MNKDKDYLGCGIGIFIASIGAIIPMAIYMQGKTNVANLELEKAKIEKGYILYEKDLNHNGLPEAFYEINGKKYFLSIDGKNLEDTLKK